MAVDVIMNFKKGGGSTLEVLYGDVTLTPTLLHTLSGTAVLPASTKRDLIDGQTTFPQVAPTPAPVDGQIEWGYVVRVADNFGHAWEYTVGVPDVVGPVNFVDLPRYFETRPPAYGEGPRGPAGQSATIQVGTVSSGVAPAVVNSGTPTNAVLDFTLAKGDKGDKGDSSTYLGYNVKNFADAPSTYPAGVTTTRGTSGMGWPYAVVGVTTSYADAAGTAWQVIKDYGTNAIPLIRWANGGTANTWTGTQPMIPGLATPLLNGLMPATDKAKLDNMQMLTNSKTFAALASTYPTGGSTVLVRAADGWPVATNAQVFTTKPPTGNAGVGQWVVPTDGSPTLYRSSDAAGNWTTVQTVGSREYTAARTDANLLNSAAKLDGTTDDTVAVQEYLDSLAPGTTVTMPKDKTLKVNGPLNITKSLKIRAWTMALGTNNKGFYITAHDVSVLDSKLNGVGIAAGYVNGNRAIRAEGVKGAPLRGLRIEYNEITGINDTGISTAWTLGEKVLYNRVETFNYAGILSSSVVDSTIEGNYIKGAVHNGNINSYGIAVTDLTNIVADRSKRVMIRGNFVFDIPEWEGIDTHGGEAISIIGNVIYGTRRAICALQGNSDRLAAPQKTVITGNIIDGAGVPAATTGITLAGNTDLSMLADGVVSGNAVYNCTTPSVIVRVDWSKTEVVGNVGIRDGNDPGWSAFETDAYQTGWSSNTTYPARYRFNRNGGKTTVYIEGVLSRSTGAVNTSLIQLPPDLIPGYAKIVGPSTTTTRMAGVLEITPAGRLRYIFTDAVDGNLSITCTYSF